LTEVFANDFHTADQRFGQHPVRGPVPAKKDVRAFHDFVFQTVIKVVMHLLDKFFVIQFAEDDVVFFVRHLLFLDPKQEGVPPVYEETHLDQTSICDL